MEVLGEAPPDLLIERPGAAVERDRLVQLGAVCLVRERAPRRADDRERRREEPLQGEVVKRRDELALGEVAGAAEDDDRRGLRDACEPEPFAQRVEGRGGQSL
jgi:hypothetical protein